MRAFIENHKIEFIFVLFALLLSTWLMSSTFSYGNGYMIIASKAWSDFASTIPLIRSFSLGVNFPPQYPLFPGEPIHYHFLFYFFVGLLEKLGIRIDFALNIPSVISFTWLLFITYFFAKKIFKSIIIGILSVIFFLFNGSLSFIEFLKTHPISGNILNDIISNKTFPSFGPYDGKIVSAFWNLNIYTNQRHLAGTFAFSLLIIYLFLIPILKKQKINFKVNILLGIVLGLLFYFHLAVFLMTVVVLILLSIFFKELRISGLTTLAIAVLIAIPQYIYLQSETAAFKPFLSPGYLASFNLTFFSFIKYWLYNLGLHSILIPIGFFLSNRNSKKIFMSFFIFFIIGNLIQFSPEIAANHKFFNYFMLLGNMFSACTIVYFWKKSFILKPIVFVLFILLTLSGIIDFFPVYNDSKITLSDYPINKDIKWIKDNTPGNSVFLNSQYLYDSASLAGRKIFLGWPYFPWSAGYDTNTRGDELKQILSSTDKKNACILLSENKIDYLEIKVENVIADSNYPNVSKLFKEKFIPVYRNSAGNYFIYKTKANCINL